MKRLPAQGSRQIQIGNRIIAAPKFQIGDWVVNVVDVPNHPDSYFHDPASSKRRFFWWTRGVVTAVRYNTEPIRFDGENWVYSVLIAEEESNRLSSPFFEGEDEFSESQLKYSFYCQRFKSELSQRLPEQRRVN